MNIIETNDLDLNIGEGSFDYSLSERSHYIEKLVTDFSATGQEFVITIKRGPMEWAITLPESIAKATYRVAYRQTKKP